MTDLKSVEADRRFLFTDLRSVKADRRFPFTDCRTVKTDIEDFSKSFNSV
jgi:hypothetical protein